MQNATTWAEYPFTIEGVAFVSKLDTNGTMYAQIKKLGISSEVFINMNRQAILELIGNPAKMLRQDLAKEIDKINEGGTQAFLCLL